MKTRVLPAAVTVFLFFILPHAPQAGAQTSTGSSGLAPLPPMAPPMATSMDNPQVAAEKQLTVGVWHLTGSKGSDDVVFRPDGTVTILNTSGAGQIHWKITPKEVVITFGNRKMTLTLPLNPGGTTRGVDAARRPLTATWSYAPAPPIARATPPPARSTSPQQPAAPGSQGSNSSGSSVFGNTQESTITTQDTPAQ